MEYAIQQFNKYTFTQNKNPSTLLNHIQLLFTEDLLFPYSHAIPPLLLNLFEKIQNDKFMSKEIISHIVIPHAMARLAEKYLNSTNINLIQNSMLDYYMRFFSKKNSQQVPSSNFFQPKNPLKPHYSHRLLINHYFHKISPKKEEKSQKENIENKKQLR